MVDLTGLRRAGAVLAALCGLLLMSAPADAQWMRLAPALTCGGDSSLYGVDMRGNLLLAVGEDGAAYRSTDGAQSVVSVDIAGRVDLYAARFASPSLAVVAGDSGTVARSIDGGASWSAQRLAGFSQRALYALAWADPRTVVACGGSSAVAHGGVALPDGVIVRSTDAGLTWETAYTNATAFVWRLAALRRASGDAVLLATAYSPLTQGSLLVSTDFGGGWTATQSLPFLPHDVAALETGAGDWILTAGGNPFNLAAPPRIALQRPDRSWIVVPDTFATGGFAWSVLLHLDAARTTSPDTPVMTVACNDGSLLESLDGGATWRRGERPSTCAIYALAVDDVRSAARLVAAGSGRALLARAARPTHAGVPDPNLLYWIGEPYPQPVAGVVTVPYTAAGSVRIDLIDLLGRVVQRHDAVAPGAHTVQFDLTGLLRGCYHLRLHTSRGILARPILR